MRHAFAFPSGIGPIHDPSMVWPAQPKVVRAIAALTVAPRHDRTMGITIPVAHDFICPWCWVGLLQARRLQQEFNVRLDWLGFELFPVELEWPEYTPGPPPPANKPPTLSRFEFLLAADDIEMPTATRPKGMRTFNAHEAVEYAKTEGVADELVEVLYRAYWEKGEDINDLETLKTLATGVVKDLESFADAISTQKFKANIVGFDDEAYAKGIYNVPTFYIGGHRYAEMPYSTLSKALKEAIEKESDLPG